MWPGAVASCVLPVGLGLIFTGVFMLPAHQSALFMSLPISLCFVFGAPLSAWLACRRLRSIDDLSRLSRWRTSFWAGLMWSSAVHFGAAFLYTIGFMILVTSQGGSGSDDQIAMTLLFSTNINLMLWCVLTLPFALTCSTIFWAGTKFPEDEAEDVFGG